MIISFRHYQRLSLKKLYELIDEAAKQDDCAELNRDLDSAGYSRIKVNGKKIGIHRIALERKLGRVIRPGYLACHSCDNSTCINTNHLWEGTQSDNHWDAIGKGRKKHWGR